MFKRLGFSILILWVFTLGLLVFSPLVLTPISASSLKSSFLFLETMEINTSGIGLIALVTPSTNFGSGGNFNITFSDSALGNWCKAYEQSLTVTGISSSEVGGIDSPLPGTLVGTCHQHADGDYIEITGLGALTGEVGYGLQISSNANFSTGPNLGNNRVLFELSLGAQIESKLFSVYLVSNDKVHISAFVSDADSIICDISTSSVSLGTLYKGGTYITATHQLGTSTTGGSKGYYWTVFGRGDNSTNAGLYNPSYLIPSLGNTTNLLTGEGFGLIVEPPSGSTVPSDFQNITAGIFGSVRLGFQNARMILYKNSEQTEHVQATVFLGARASIDAVAGEYEEILTYVCGGYVGAY